MPLSLLAISINAMYNNLDQCKYEKYQINLTLFYFLSKIKISDSELRINMLK